ncbi:ubiquitin-specific protease ubp2 [Blyttiomyces sp. JEL0837]|nr:ubiquitin-specific protease ubp2 [Blyttiomyces sp. JEL0837]
MTCCGCKDSITLEYQPSRVPNQTLKSLLHAKTETERINTINIFLAYTRGLLKGIEKPVNAQNEKFAMFVGVNDHAKLIMTVLGYFYNEEDKCFHVLPEIGGEEVKVQKLRQIEEELCLKQIELYNRRSLPPKEDTIKFVDGLSKLANRMGLMYRAKLKELMQANSSLDSHYFTLGCVSDSKIDDLKNAFTAQAKDDPKLMPWLLDSIIAIAQSKRNPDLDEFVAIERTSRNVPSLTEVKQAYTQFGLSDTDNAPDMVIIAMFNQLLSETPQKLDELRGALRIIAEVRDSAVLSVFLETGEVAPQLAVGASSMDMDGISMNMPMGLKNLASICYLNSLMQFYLTVNPVRRIAIDFNSSDTSDQPSDPNTEQLTDSEDKTQIAARNGQTFIIHLRNLFLRLMSLNDTRYVEPDKQLAELALGRGNESLGTQQDINECMDNVMTLIENGLKSTEDENLTMLKSLFYGTTVQSLSYFDEHTKLQKHEKEEEFLSLIVDVVPDIYMALDNLFRESEVEYEGRKALRSIRLKKVPPIFTVTINRVQFDMNSSSAYKSNEFMRFYNRIYLDRYMNTAPADAFSISFIPPMTETSPAAMIEGPEIPSNLNKMPYLLHAVFIHEGDSTFGHYRVFLRDHELNRWLLYDDERVSEVFDPSLEVFGDTTGRMANAYCLIYVEEGEYKDLVKTVVR